jgi:hypothetical protein
MFSAYEARFVPASAPVARFMLFPTNAGWRQPIRVTKDEPVEERTETLVKEESKQNDNGNWNSQHPEKKGTAHGILL